MWYLESKHQLDHMFNLNHVNSTCFKDEIQIQIPNRDGIEKSIEYSIVANPRNLYLKLFLRFSRVNFAHYGDI